MAKRPTIKQPSNASIKIYELFIKKIVDYFYIPNHPVLSDREWIIENLVFHEGEREVLQCKARKSFNMPGYFKTHSGKYIPGVIATVQRNQVMWVRHDKSEPNVFDIEFMNGNRTMEFRMSRHLWRRVKQNLYKTAVNRKNRIKKDRKKQRESERYIEFLRRRHRDEEEKGF